jgi:hypothetical protein
MLVSLTRLAAHILSFLLVFTSTNAAPDLQEVSFRATVHQYLQKPPEDPFSKIKDLLESGQLSNAGQSQLDHLVVLLKKLNVSVHSQQLVFSTTSLQLSRISPRNPRAIYFNEDVYLGYVPGGQIEVMGIDPKLGAIPYIFSPPSPGERIWRPNIIRSKRCMNCHASQDIGGIPGLLLSSVIPGPGGGSLDAFRQKQTGHSIPYELRFGGWHLTGDRTFPSSWANSTGVMNASEIVKVRNPPGIHFNWNKYPVAQSDVIANLILEHQVGFVNRCIAANYRLRELHEKQGVSEEQKKAMQDGEARAIVEYALFATEARLPIAIPFDNSLFAKDFEGRGLPSPTGKHLRKLNLKSRLLQRRCSYMLGSLSFKGLPNWFRILIFSEIQSIMTKPRKKLSEKFSYLGEQERREIDEILKARFPDYANVK